MRTLAGYVGNYYREEHRWWRFLLVLLFLCGTTSLFYLNKTAASWIGGGAAGYWRLPADLIVFGISFLFPLLLLPNEKAKKEAMLNPGFILMVFFALAIFCFKVFFYWQRPISSFFFGNENLSYWQNVLSNGISAMLLIIPVVIYWLFIRKNEPGCFGIGKKIPDWKPYLIILCIMIPVTLVMSTQSSFLSQYPKALLSLERGHVVEGRTGHALLFEAFYGMDFIATEIFFRGFLVIGLSRFIGRSAILPAAVFYVFIHYGKPLPETLGSFFGGLGLGIIAYETRSIWSGVVLHLGIAWIMEAGAAFFH